jgi:hypothetical protein
MERSTISGSISDELQQIYSEVRYSSCHGLISMLSLTCSETLFRCHLPASARRQVHRIVHAVMLERLEEGTQFKVKWNSLERRSEQGRLLRSTSR